MTSITSAATTEGQPHVTTQRRTLVVFAYVTLLISLSVHGFWGAFVPGDKTPLV